jgi:aryl-alcohol dehydrogenase-like predicted oxidoreductase
VPRLGSGTPIDETVATLDGFVRSGKVRYVGCSNFTACQIVESAWATERACGTPFIAVQSQYSLLARDIEAEILPVAARYGLGALVWSPLAGGILAGRYLNDGEPDSDTRLGKLMSSKIPEARTWAQEQLCDRNLNVAAEVAKAAAELNTTPAAVALAWTRSRPGITAVIIGPRTPAQYEQNLAGFALELPAAWTARLDAISGPPPRPITGTAGRGWLRQRRPGESVVA